MTKSKTSIQVPYQTIWASKPQSGLGLASLFQIDLVADDWNIYGKGSVQKKIANKLTNKIVLLLIDDFVDDGGKLKPLKKNVNDYLRNASSFSKKVDQLHLNYSFESDQQLRKVYYKAVALQIVEAISIKMLASGTYDQDLIPKIKKL